MGVITKQLPICDRCGAITLPKPLLPDGSPNPAFENPRLQKRCGSCKSPAWNYKEEGSEEHPILSRADENRRSKRATEPRLRYAR